VALIRLLFPLVGIWLIACAIRRTREWRRFGAAPVTLDPVPGSIGLPRPYASRDDTGDGELLGPEVLT
jgi:hypothetical protein